MKYLQSNAIVEWIHFTITSAITTSIEQTCFKDVVQRVDDTCNKAQYALQTTHHRDQSPSMEIENTEKNIMFDPTTKLPNIQKSVRDSCEGWRKCFIGYKVIYFQTGCREPHFFFQINNTCFQVDVCNFLKVESSHGFIRMVYPKQVY